MGVGLVMGVPTVVVLLEFVRVFAWSAMGSVVGVGVTGEGAVGAFGLGTALVSAWIPLGFVVVLGLFVPRGVSEGGEPSSTCFHSSSSESTLSPLSSPEPCSLEDG